MWPPGEIVHGRQIPEFNISQGGLYPSKPAEFKVQYQFDPGYTVSFGFKVSSDNGKNIFHCFTEADHPDISIGSYKHCNAGTTEYIFIPGKK